MYFSVASWGGDGGLGIRAIDRSTHRLEAALTLPGTI
jgi:hypothetical protein